MILLLLILAFEPFVAADKPPAHLRNTSVSYMNDSTYYANLKLLSTVLDIHRAIQEYLDPSLQGCIATASVPRWWQLFGPRDELV